MTNLWQIEWQIYGKLNGKFKKQNKNKFQCYVNPA